MEKFSWRAGEYYVCAELCRRGILALVKLKNNPLYDIVAADPLGNRSVSIRVKTISLQNKHSQKMAFAVSWYIVSSEICLDVSWGNDFYISGNIANKNTT